MWWMLNDERKGGGMHATSMSLEHDRRRTKTTEKHYRYLIPLHHDHIRHQIFHTTYIFFTAKFILLVVENLLDGFKRASQ